MLWFKNVMIYRLSRDVSLSADEMEKQLKPLTFTPCGEAGIWQKRDGFLLWVQTATL